MSTNISLCVPEVFKLRCTSPEGRERAEGAKVRDEEKILCEVKGAGACQCSKKQ